MFIQAVEDIRVPHGGREHLLESQKDFGYVYDVPDDLGKAAIATGKCTEVKGYEGPGEIPWSTKIQE